MLNKKIKKGKGKKRLGVTILDREAKENLTEKVTFMSRPKMSGSSSTNI